MIVWTDPDAPRYALHIRGVALVCWLFSHGAPMWRVGPKGLEWTCERCGRTTPSTLNHLKPGQLA